MQSLCTIGHYGKRCWLSWNLWHRYGKRHSLIIVYDWLKKCRLHDTIYIRVCKTIAKWGVIGRLGMIQSYHLVEPWVRHYTVFYWEAAQRQVRVVLVVSAKN